ncbi:MAG: carboxypeptidase regulatory-like domain-containing protein [bacterium]
MLKKLLPVALGILLAAVFTAGCGGGGGGAGGVGGTMNNGQVNGKVTLPGYEGAGRVAGGGGARLAMAPLPREGFQIAQGTTVQACVLNDSGQVTTECYSGTLTPSATEPSEASFTISNLPTDEENMIVQVIPPGSTDPLVEAIVPAVLTGTDAANNPVYVTFETDAEADIAKALIAELKAANVADPVGELDIIQLKETITPDMALSADFFDSTRRGQVVSGIAQSLRKAHETLRAQLKAAGAGDTDIPAIMKQIAKEEMKKELLLEKAHYEGVSVDSIASQLEAIEQAISSKKETVMEAIAGLTPANLGLQEDGAVFDAAAEMAADAFNDDVSGTLATACAGCDASLVNLVEAIGEAQSLLNDIREKLIVLLPPATMEGAMPVPPPLKILAHTLQIDWAIIEGQMRLVQDAKRKLEAALSDPTADPNVVREEFDRTIKNVRDALLTVYVGLSYEAITSIETKLDAAQAKVVTALDAAALTPTVMNTFHADVDAAFANLDTYVPAQPNGVTLTAEQRSRLLWAIRDIFIHTTIHLPPHILKPKDGDSDGCPDFIDTDDTSAAVSNCPKPADVQPQETTLTDSDSDGYPDRIEQDFGTDPSDATSHPDDVAGTDPVFCIALAGAACPLPKPSDGVDNDGDGSVDEELPDGIDNDGNNGIDEDIMNPENVPMAKVSGTILYNNAPVESAYAGLFLSPDFMGAQPVNGGGPTGADGKFTIVGVKPGTYFVAGFKDVNLDGMPTPDCDAFGFYGTEVTDPSGAKKYVALPLDVPFGTSSVTIDKIVVVKQASTTCAPVTVTNAGAVSGTVKKADGSAVPGAGVSAIVPPNSTTMPPAVPAPTSTDANGAFTIQKVPAGMWEIVTFIERATSTGTTDIKRLSQIVTVTANATATVNFVLMDEAPPCSLTTTACPAHSFLNFECGCVCEMGYKPVISTTTGALVSCEVPPATCNLSCTGDNEILLGDICECGCLMGYVRVYIPDATGLMTPKCVGPVGSIGGQAADANGNGVPGAGIHLYCIPSTADLASHCDAALQMGYQPPQDIVTDETGKFFVGAVPVGKWDVKAVSLQMQKYGVKQGVAVATATQSFATVVLDTPLDSTLCPEGTAFDATLNTCVFNCPPELVTGGGSVTCVTLWAPVCGWSASSTTKKTYSNECVACTSGEVQSYIKGECPTATVGI